MDYIHQLLLLFLRHRHLLDRRDVVVSCSLLCRQIRKYILYRQVESIWEEGVLHRHEMILYSTIHYQGQGQGNQGQDYQENQGQDQDRDRGPEGHSNNYLFLRSIRVSLHSDQVRSIRRSFYRCLLTYYMDRVGWS
jgi:hypothetical protein